MGLWASQLTCHRAAGGPRSWLPHLGPLWHATTLGRDLSDNTRAFAVFVFLSMAFDSSGRMSLLDYIVQISYRPLLLSLRLSQKPRRIYSLGVGKSNPKCDCGTCCSRFLLTSPHSYKRGTTLIPVWERRPSRCRKEAFCPVWYSWWGRAGTAHSTEAHPWTTLFPGW